MGTLDSAVGSDSLAESTPHNIEVRSSDATVCIFVVDCTAKSVSALICYQCFG